MDTKVALSLAHAAVCAHCGNPLNQTGVVGSYLLLPCSRRTCRDEYDGAWNLLVRAGDVLFSIAVTRRLSQSLRLHLSRSAPPEDIRGLITASGALWKGPVAE